MALSEQRSVRNTSEEPHVIEDEHYLERENYHMSPEYPSLDRFLGN